MQPYSEHHYPGCEVPHDQCSKVRLLRSLFPTSNYLSALTASNRCDPPFMTLEVSVTLLANTLDGKYCALCPQEMHVRWMHHDTVLLREVEPNTSCYIEKRLIVYHLSNLNSCLILSMLVTAQLKFGFMVC